MYFNAVGIAIKRQGSGIHEIGIDSATKKTVVAIDAKYFRPTEVDYLLGNPDKATKVLNWKPKITFDELVALVVDYDCKLVH